VPERAFPAAAGANDQYLLAGIDLQVDIMQGGFSLAEILKRKILELNDGLIIQERPNPFSWLSMDVCSSFDAAPTLFV